VILFFRPQSRARDASKAGKGGGDQTNQRSDNEHQSGHYKERGHDEGVPNVQDVSLRDSSVSK